MPSMIKHIENYLPEFILSNDILANQFGRWEPEKIERKIGISERRIASTNETAGDMAYQAAEIAFQAFDRSKIDMIMLCTQSPDYFLPTTACILQERLKLKNNIGAFDYNLGCSGYIYGLAMAKSFINSGLSENVLLVMSETYSKHIHKKDLGNKTIFGDGASATIVSKSDKEYIHEFILGTDGSGAHNLIVKNGGFRTPYNQNATEIKNDSGDISTDNNLYMNGPEIFNFTIKAVPVVIEQCLTKNSITLEDVDYFIFHQANKFMIDYLRKKIKIPKDKFYSNMLHVGNTVSATIPIGLKDCLDRGVVKSGAKVILCGFGVGYSWGAVLIEI